MDNQIGRQQPAPRHHLPILLFLLLTSSSKVHMPGPLNLWIYLNMLWIRAALG